MSVRKRFRCGQCNMELGSPEQPCPKCGPVGLVQIATADEAVIVADDFAAGVLGNKYKPGPGRKVRRTREYSNVAGAWNQDPKRPTRQIQDIYRVNNLKMHVVKDAATGKELMKKIEALDVAVGRGSDKLPLRALRQKRKEDAKR